tara:strand:+ start:1119 stop:2447 length:1329 start_codon:yes stop_codon:yes gene_type:complete
MRIAMIGTGYVGLVSGACFSEFGVDVVCVDKIQEKIDRLASANIPIYEPGLESLVKANMDSGRLTFSTSMASAVAGADAVFIAVGTPSRRGDGHADLSYVYSAAEEISDSLTGHTVIVTKSTVPVGTGDEIERRIVQRRPDLRLGEDFDVVSNPEFLREGSAIEDFMRPDRVVVGAHSDYARDILRKLYRPLFLRDTPVLFTDRCTAELTKYASNAFLATKITFINEIANLCEAVGANVQDVARGMGLDGRIGQKFLHAGPGFGGSCFPKDTIALARTSEDFGSPIQLVNTVIAVNKLRRGQMADKVIEACGGTVADDNIAILGLTFKPNTDDIRNAPSLDIILALQAAGARISVYDPVGMTAASKHLKGVVWGSSAYDILDGARALVIITEWNEFRALDLGRIRSLMATPLIVDLRNIYGLEDMREEAIRYVSVGRPEITQ